MRIVLRSIIASGALALSCGAIAQDVVPNERVKRGVILRQLPSTSAEAVGALAPGGRAEFKEDLRGWYRVRLPDGHEGFVSKIWTEIEGEPLALTPTAAQGSYKMHVIDVGTGLAIFVEGPDFTLLYDAGSQDDLASGSDNRVIAYIEKVHPGLTAIDHVILSHPHKDHLQLLPDVFDRYVVRNVWNSGAINKTQGYCRFLKKVAGEEGVRYHDAIASSGRYKVTFSGSGCSGTVQISRSAMMTAAPVTLGPGAQMTMLYRNAEQHSDPNENTVVVRLDLGVRRILLAGDAESGGRALPASEPQAGSIEAELLKEPTTIKADVLVVGHHGSLTSSRAKFLDAVGAKSFIISSGPFPYRKVQLPDLEIVAELGRRGQVFSTKTGDDDCGDAEAKIGPDHDESPGGCDNVVASIAANGDLTVNYNRSAD